MEWLMKKKKAFDQRGDMAIAAWAEQQQRELNIRVRQLSRSKVSIFSFCNSIWFISKIHCMLLDLKLYVRNTQIVFNT